MDIGENGDTMVTVQHSVELEPNQERDIVITQHLLMVDMNVLVMIHTVNLVLATSVQVSLHIN